MKLLTSLLTLLAALNLYAKTDKVVTKQQVYTGWVDLLESDSSALGMKHWRTVSCPLSTFKLTTDNDNKPMINCNGKPYGLLRSAEIYENFVFECEWRHMTRDGMKANAGIFVWSDALPEVFNPFSRAIEIQVANFAKNGHWFTRHGDIFAIQGAKLTPDPRFASTKGRQRSMPIEYRAKGTGEWNHYRITCIDGTIQLEVNGRLVSAGYHASPRKGHIVLESEGGEVHFRNMKVLPLKGSGTLTPAMIAKSLPKDTKVTPLYSGLDFAEWDTSEVSQKNGFHVKDYQFSVKSNSGKISRKFIPKNGDYTLQIDFFNKLPISALPLSITGITLPNTLDIKKGKHRFSLISKTLGDGKIQQTLLLDGKPLSLANKSATIKEMTLTIQSNPQHEIALMNLFLIE